MIFKKCREKLCVGNRINLVHLGLNVRDDAYMVSKSMVKTRDKCGIHCLRLKLSNLT